MAQLTHNGKTYDIYVDISNGLEFIMENNEVEKFQKLVRESKKVEDIPKTNLLTGIYLNKARLVQGIPYEEIAASNVRFA